MMTFKRLTAGFIAVTFGLTQTPFVYAQEIVAAPVVVVPKSVDALQKDIVDQDRMNRDEEIRVRQLIEDNDKLTQQNPAISASIKAVNEAMTAYAKAVIERDRIRIATNSRNVREINPTTFETDPVYVDGLREQLEGKKESLQDKYRDLTMLRNELAEINERLRGANSKQDVLLVQYAKNVDELKGKLSDQSSEYIGKLSDLQAELAKKNAELAQLRTDNLNQRSKINTLADALSTKTSQMSDMQLTWDNKALQLQELTGRLANYDAKIAQYDQTISAKEATIADLRSRLSKSDDLVADLKSRLANLNDKIVAETDKQSDWQSTIDALKAESANTAKELKAKEAKIDELSEQLAKANSLIEEKDTIAKAVNDKEVKIEELNQQLVKAKSLVEEKETIVKEAHQTVKLSREELSRIKNDVTNSQEENTKTLILLQQQLAELKADFDSKNKDFSSIEEAVVTLQNTIKDKDDLLATKNKEVTAVKEELAKALTNTAKANEQEARIKSIGDEMAQLQQALKDKDALIAQRTEQRDSYRAQALRVDEIGKEIDDIKAHIARRDQQQLFNDEAQLKYSLAKDLINKQEEQISLLLEKQQLNKARSEQISTNVDDLKARITAYLASHQDISSDLKNKLAALNDRVAQQEGLVTEIKEELKAKIAESARQEEMLNVYQQKLAEKVSNSDQTAKELMAAKMRQSQLEATITNLNDQLQLKEAEIKKVKDYFYELEQRSAQKDQDLKAKDLAMTMIQQAVDQQKKELITLRQDLALAREEKEAAVATAASLKNIPQPKPVVVTKEVIITKEDKEALGKLQDEVTAANKKIADLSSQLVGNQQEINRLKLEVTNKTKTSESVSGDIRNLTSQVNRNKEELNRRITDLQYKEMELKRLKEQFGVKEKDYVAQIDALTKKVKALETKSKNAVSPEELNAIKAELAKSQKEIRAMRDNLGIKTDEIIKLREQLKKAQALLPTVKSPDKTAALNEEINGLKKQLAEAVSKQDRGDIKQALKDAEEQLVASREEMDQSQDQVKSLQGEVKRLKAQLNEAQAAIESTKKLPVVDEKELNRYKKEVDALTDKLADANSRLKKADEIKEAYAKMQQELNQTRELLEKNDTALSQLQSKVGISAQAEKDNAVLKKTVEEYQANIKKLNDEVANLSKKLADKSSDDLANQLKQKEKQLATLEKELKYKTESFLSQQQEIDNLRRELKNAKGQVDTFSVQIKEYREMANQLGIGNQGFLVRDGRSTAKILYEVNERIKGVQTQLTKTISERDDVKKDYANLKAQLDEARTMLQACMAKVMSQTK